MLFAPMKIKMILIPPPQLPRARCAIDSGADTARARGGDLDELTIKSVVKQLSAHFGALRLGTLLEAAARVLRAS